MSETQAPPAGRTRSGRGAERRHAGQVRCPIGHTVIRELGCGSLGSAILCREDASDRQFVVKVLDAGPRDQRARLVFESELQAVAVASRHGFSVPIERVWFDDNSGFCLRQRFCPGGHAQAVLDSAGRLKADDVVVLGIRATAALSHMHRHGVLHLDVRPANFFRDAAGQWSLADGGLTRAVQRADPPAGVTFDLRYASRELFGWEEPGPASDVYALGATLYALLVGEPASATAALQGDAAVYTAALGTPLVPPSEHVPTGLAALISRMMASDAAARPPLTEVGRLLRAQVSPAVAAQVPVAETAEGPSVVALPAPTIGSARPDVSAVDAHRRQRTRVRLAAGVLGLLFVASAGVVVATSGEDEAAQLVVAADPGTGVSLPPIPDAEKADFVAKSVALGFKGTAILVGWDEPKNAAQVAGYLVLAKYQDKIEARLFASPGQLGVVFNSPPVRTTTCFTVHTLADNGTSLRTVESEQVCAADALAEKKAAEAQRVPAPARAPAPAPTAQKSKAKPAETSKKTTEKSGASAGR